MKGFPLNSHNEVPQCMRPLFKVVVASWSSTEGDLDIVLTTPALSMSHLKLLPVHYDAHRYLKKNNNFFFKQQTSSLEATNIILGPMLRPLPPPIVYNPSFSHGFAVEQ